MRLQSAIFDMDGTLLDSMPTWRELGPTFLKEAGITATPEQDRMLHTLADCDVIPYLREVCGLPWSQQEIIDQIIQRMEIFYSSQVRPKPGLEKFLSILKMEGVWMYVATATHRRLTEKALKTAGIDHYFRGIVTSADAGNHKSESADIYEMAMRRLQSNKRDTVVFEDALHAIRTAKAAGFRVAGVYEATAEQAAPEDAKEVDYLKKVKRRGWRRVAAAVAVTVLLFAVGVAAKLFLIGTPIQTQGMSWVISTDVPGQLDIRVYSIWSGTACRQWETEQEPEGIVRVTCRQVLPSPLSNSGDYRAVLNTEGVNAVYLGDQLIWQGGVEISPQIDRIYQAQTPYVGDAPAVGRVLNALRFDTCGSYTLELHTSSAPYRLTLNFSVPQTSGKMGDSEKGLYQDMAAVLAIIGNLDEIECAFRDENGQPWSRVLTVEELNQDLPQIVADYNERFSHGKPCPLYDDVKDYAGSCADLEQLYDAMWWAGEGGIYAETK